MNETLKKKFEDFKEGFMQGLGWSFGVTIGFVLVSTILVLVLNMLGGVPLIGNGIASIVQATQISLIKRSSIIPQ
jgi:hypothetical protein